MARGGGHGSLGARARAMPHKANRRGRV
jgi:hypothetical protein